MDIEINNNKNIVDIDISSYLFRYIGITILTLLLIYAALFLTTSGLSSGFMSSSASNDVLLHFYIIIPWSIFGAFISGCIFSSLYYLYAVKKIKKNGIRTEINYAQKGPVLSMPYILLLISAIIILAISIVKSDHAISISSIFSIDFMSIFSIVTMSLCSATYIVPVFLILIFVIPSTTMKAIKKTSLMYQNIQIVSK